jgi:hypothetical protein
MEREMTGIPAAARAAAGVLMLTAPAFAQAPVAVVEELQGNPPGVEFMDYVEAGKVIRLGERDSIVLGYLKSCWREAISGGTVTVGAEQSTVKDGKVVRGKVACDGGNMQLTTQQANHSGGMVFRDRPRRGQQPATPPVTLYGQSPVIEMKGGGTLIIERIDRPDERYEVVIAAKELVNGSFYDMAKTDKTLTAGGTYRASVGDREIMFKVDAQAKPGPTPVIGRLLRIIPAS